MKSNDIEFKAEESIDSVEALARHAAVKKKLTLRTKSLKLPKTHRRSRLITRFGL